ncbi:hypothetical protein ASPWEDRAFT_507787 [Aspergillus wentii DTO 134E9]|uniref:Endopolyphosphatase n=1 Tax=Aspergillus wentii DTO 134E9 TaxID=1073089 RepID=A0A1L9RKF5_ASPWE|nr:uncharacterized protein ASPWEDRAFT_507787 [Aspergillus wentii DTO 134E9]OJJ35412.1 hypothetical protein ASPWEDRAFT_507787 [Aspergillus wentii DTO 134E9]
MTSILLALALWTANAAGVPVAEQLPLGVGSGSVAQPSRGLTGRFLHITDLHPDPHYVPGTSTDDACHRGHGSTGYFGAEGSECDAPLSLINETFRWIENNLKGKVDFVIWTGDSARHDNDDDIPRTEKEVIQLNEVIAQQFINVFAVDGDVVDKVQPNLGLSIPIIPTIGNNDVMPHNIFEEGPNRWTKELSETWSKFIPEIQRHTFVEGGWFTTEVIPGKLAVISLNTMYFFQSNSAVDGCEDKSEPGYEHMEWLRVQLKLLRGRNMKAILMGHVPPARTGSKKNWYETCWQKYALWKNQYRDVVVGDLYGHMNTDHFMLHDNHEVEIADIGQSDASRSSQDKLPNNISIQGTKEYLDSLRDQWADLPSPPSEILSLDSTDDWFREDVATFGDDALDDPKVQGKKKRMRKFLRKIGGPWAERYCVSLTMSSLVPNYFPSLRVVEYNISGLEDTPTWAEVGSSMSISDSSYSDEDAEEEYSHQADQPLDEEGKKKKKKKPKFKVPEPPSATSPPGPAYSNQPFTFLGYTQYFANLTRINREYEELSASTSNTDKKHDLLSFEVEYDTKNDDVYKMQDLTVRSFFKLASQIAAGSSNADDISADGKKKKKKKNKFWRTFLSRAYVGFYDDDELNDL